MRSRIQRRIGVSAKPLTESRLGRDSQSAPPRVFDNEIGYGDPLAQVDVYLSPESAARFLDVSRKFIYEMIARKEIEAVTVGGRLRRIRISTLEKWLKRSISR